MLYRNETENPLMVRIDDEKISRWKTVKPGEIIDMKGTPSRDLTEVKEVNSQNEKSILNEEIVEKPINEFIKVVEGETVFEDNSNYKRDLLKIKGIGNNTMNDILNIYPTKKSLLKALEEGKDIPIRNDAAQNLKKNFK